MTIWPAPEGNNRPQSEIDPLVGLLRTLVTKNNGLESADLASEQIRKTTGCLNNKQVRSFMKHSG